MSQECNLDPAVKNGVGFSLAFSISAATRWVTGGNGSIDPLVLKFGDAAFQYRLGTLDRGSADIE